MVQERVHQGVVGDAEIWNTRGAVRASVSTLTEQKMGTVTGAHTNLEQMEIASGAPVAVPVFFAGVMATTEKIWDSSAAPQSHAFRPRRCEQDTYNLESISDARLEQSHFFSGALVTLCYFWEASFLSTQRLYRAIPDS